MIKIKNLTKSFGSKIAVDIDQLTIPQGDLLGLVGNNGAGKTTLFRLLLDLLKADKGEAIVKEINVSQNEEWKTFTGAFIDDGFLIDYLTPEEYFHFAGKMYGMSKEEVNLELKKYERFMGDEILGQKKYIRNFSAGNKQKVGIISAMLHKPQLLILDEPFNYLDPTSQAVIRNLLKKYNEDTGATVLISSHNLNHTVEISKHVVLLEKGKVIRHIDNQLGNAEQELEEYFEVKEENIASLLTPETEEKGEESIKKVDE